MYNFFRFLFFAFLLVNIIGLFKSSIFLFFINPKKRKRKILLLICLPIYIILFVLMGVTGGNKFDLSTFIAYIVGVIFINVLTALIGGLITPKKFWPGKNANRLKISALYFISLCILIGILSKVGNNIQLNPNNQAYTASYSVSSVSKNDSMVSKLGGLGDTLDTWENQYGNYKGDTSLASFENNYLLTIFANNRADNITIQFEQTDNKARTKDEAIAAYQGMLPTDAKKINETTQDNKDIIFYHSDILANVLDKDEFQDAPAGTMMAVLEKNQNGKYANVVLAPGNNP